MTIKQYQKATCDELAIKIRDEIRGSYFMQLPIDMDDTNMLIVAAFYLGQSVKDKIAHEEMDSVKRGV